MRVDTLARLSILRRLMVARKVDVYVIPSEDSHLSEYIAACDARRQYISGFTGSSGCAVVTLDKAILATDGRYFGQAARELGDHWTLLKIGLPDVPTWQDWAAQEASGGRTIAVDPSLLPVSAVKELKEKIRRRGGLQLLPLTENLVDIVWGNDRPSRSSRPIKVLDVRFAGVEVGSKLQQVRTEIAKQNASALILSSLDDIAWLLNLRGDDISFNPVFYSYSIITTDRATLYVEQSKLDRACRDHLASNSVQIKPYDDVFDDLAVLSKKLMANNHGSDAPSMPFLLPDKSSWALKLALGCDAGISELRSPVSDLKTIKNDTELNGMRACHERDGAALVEFFAWLEHQLVNEQLRIDEVAAADKLQSIRERKEHYVGLSFPTISATGANAAIIHYTPQRETCSVIDPKSIYLCDSGAQYLDGTTDTTRTLHFGTPTEAQKRAYTLVLKGNIALDTAVFPENTTGYSLDSLARQFLRRDGLDYRHGTGHGVGCYLNVHEGPIAIGTRPKHAHISLSAGNVLSIEPGYYEDGSYGIRIENVAIVTQIQTRNCFEGQPFLGFEHVTMVPYCRNLIDISLLTLEEREWLNCHHALILEKMERRFRDDQLTMRWLKRETQPF